MKAADLAKDNAVFAFDLLRRIGAAEGNVFISPQSISTAVAMTMPGATGRTAKALTHTFRWRTGGDALSAGFGALATDLKAPVDKDQKPRYTWTEANRLWIGAPVRETYIESLRKHFSAESGKLSGNPASDADAINAWTSEQTKGRISSLVSPADLKSARFVLTNAVYFKGAWTRPFDMAATAPRDFTLRSGEKVQPKTMARVDSVPYHKAADFAMVRLAYDGGISCILVLPDKGKLSHVTATLDEPAFAAALKSTSWTLTDLQVPKLKLQTRETLKDHLSALGGTEAFTDAATFGGMTSEPIKIGEVLHVADLEMDEKGAEAAAATSTIMAPGAPVGKRPEPPKPVEFHADRPFFIVIRHDETGAILFAGRIDDPR